jgi:CRP-like cAMP-binding protein
MGIKLDVFHNEAEGRHFAAGERIFSEHEMGFEMYVVITGEVELSINGEVIETLGEMEPFGEMALIDQAPRTATATAKTDCDILPIPEKRFLFMVQQTPYFSLQIMKVITDRLRKANERRNRK